LVSLYCIDANSAKAARLVRHLDPSVLLTPLVELELTNALQLRVFRREASVAEIRAARSELLSHVSGGFFSLSAMPATVYEIAQRMALKQSALSGTRTLDILHVASAIVLRAEEFWSFDIRQGQLAQAEGLRLR
jgi:predicted nucleic acid-binding protein